MECTDGHMSRRRETLYPSRWSAIEHAALAMYYTLDAQMLVLLLFDVRAEFQVGDKI